MSEPKMNILCRFFKSRALFLLLIGSALTVPAMAQTPCSLENRPCIIKELEKTADQIENKSWRDQTYRELAKTLAFSGEIERAIALLTKIETPDTKAMTIRGIGMAAAEAKLPAARLTTMFSQLHLEAQKITHPPSHAIALTYIAMAQAFAGDNEGAWKTAAMMENKALRHKAYGETAEIQAERNDFEAAMKSIAFIESVAYRNKAYSLISKILAERSNLPEALKAAEALTNPYKKAKALQYILDKQKSREGLHNQNKERAVID